MIAHAFALAGYTSKSGERERPLQVLQSGRAPPPTTFTHKLALCNAGKPEQHVQHRVSRSASCDNKLRQKVSVTDDHEAMSWHPPFRRDFGLTPIAGTPSPS